MNITVRALDTKYQGVKGRITSMSILKGAKETLKLYSQVRASNKQSKSNLDMASIQVAKKMYKQRTGKDFSPSDFRYDLNQGPISKEHKQYIADKKTARANYKKRFGL